MPHPEPPRPHPDDPARSHPRCSHHDRPARWDPTTGAYRCSRGRPPGHVLPSPTTGATVVWGPPPNPRGRPPSYVAHHDVVNLQLGDLGPVVRAEAQREAPEGKRPNLTATLHGLIRDGLHHRNRPATPPTDPPTDHRA